MNKPLISVIIPVYKTGEHLPKCLQSVLNQSYKNIEIILVDDGSPDNSGELCDTLALTDDRIVVLHKENGGLSSARNAGLDIAKGDFVSFVDSDDYIDEKMLEDLHSLITVHNAQIACCGIERLNQEGHLNYFNTDINEFFVVEKSEALKKLTFNTHITNSLCDKLFSVNIFKDLRMTQGIIYEDHDVMHKCIMNASRVVYTGKPYYKYFVNDNSITGGSFSEKHFLFLPVGRKRLEFYRENSPENLPFAIAQYVEWGLDLVYKSGKNKTCLALRKELIKEIKTLLKENGSLPFNKNTKLKVAFFKLGTPVYMLFLNIFYLLKG